jgi:hypothetical protein
MSSTEVTLTVNCEPPLGYLRGKRVALPAISAAHLRRRKTVPKSDAFLLGIFSVRVLVWIAPYPNERTIRGTAGGAFCNVREKYKGI